MNIFHDIQTIYYGVSSGPIGHFSEIARFKLQDLILFRTKRDGGGQGNGGDDRNSNIRMTGPQTLDELRNDSCALETGTSNMLIPDEFQITCFY